MNYKVVYPNQAAQRNVAKFLSAIPDKDSDEIMDAVMALAVHPRPGNSIKLDPPIRIFSAVAERRLKIRYYRIFYDIDDERHKVYVYGIRRRDKDTYR